MKFHFETTPHPGIQNPLLYSASLKVIDGMNSLCNITVHGEENIPDEPVVIAATHWGFPDVAVVRKAMQNRNNSLPNDQQNINLQFAAKKQLFIPILGQLFSRCGVIPIDREDPKPEALHAMIQTVLPPVNNDLTIFHAAKTEDFPQMGQTKRGVGIVACLGRRKILPIAFNGTQNYRLYPFAKDAVVAIGESIEPEDINLGYNPELDLTKEGIRNERQAFKAYSRTSREANAALRRTLSEII